MSLLTRYWIIDGFVFLFFLIIVIYLYMTRKFKYWKKLGVIEITPTPFVGNFSDCLTAKKSAGQWLDEIYNKASGLPFIGFYIFDRPCLLIRDLDLIKNILVRDFNYFQDRFAKASPDDRIGDANLFLIKNPAWKELRIKLTPIFTSGKLKKMFELMLEVGDDLHAFMDSLNLKGRGDTLDLKELCAKFSTDMIATTAFGLKVNSFIDPNAEFREAGKKIFAQTLYRNFEFTSIFFAPDIVRPLGLKFLSKDSSQFFRSTLWDVMVERERSGTKRNDLIDLLLELRRSYHESTDKGNFEYDNDNLVAQAAVFFTAGFESASTAMSFTLYELALQPDLQSRLRKEIVDGLKTTEGKITYDLVMSLPYLDMVVSETLRKYPPLPFLDRVANDDYKIPNADLVVEKGTPVFISMSSIHYDSQYFLNPQKYDPERFSSENKKTRIPGSYFPFGEGPHICIGMRIGLLETKLGLIELLPTYEFSPCNETPIPMRFTTKSLLTAADGGLFLNVKKIKDQEYDS